MTNQLNPILARAHVDDLMRAAAAERAASAQRPPRGRLTAILARRRPAPRRRRLLGITRPAAHH